MLSPEIKTASQDLKVEFPRHDMMKKETGNETTTTILVIWVQGQLPLSILRKKRLSRSLLDGFRCIPISSADQKKQLLGNAGTIHERKKYSGKRAGAADMDEWLKKSTSNGTARTMWDD